jgi:hypothetical protein
VQPVGGFSALLDAPGVGNYWAMPDNGSRTKANSHIDDARWSVSDLYGSTTTASSPSSATAPRA